MSACQTPTHTLKKHLTVFAGIKSNTIDPNPNCWVLNRDDVFQHLTSIPENVCATGSHGCPLPDGFVISGGEQSTNVMRYYTDKKSWMDLPSLPEPRHCHVSVYDNGRLYVLGGFVTHCHRPSSSVEYLDLMTPGRWDSVSDMPQGLRYPSACCIGSLLYVLDTWIRTGKLYCMDLSRHAWSTKTAPPVSPNAASLTSVGDKLYLAGGQDKVCACYLSNTDTWCALQGPALRHSSGCLLEYQGKLLLGGGSNWDTDRDEIEEYDIQKNEWKLCSFKLPEPIWWHQAMLVDVSE